MWYFLVITTPQHNCRISPHPLTLDHTQGYLSSYIASTTLCGSQHSPWVIQGREGQKINLTLYDFSVDDSVTDNTEAVTCQKYAMVSGKLTSSAVNYVSLYWKISRSTLGVQASLLKSWPKCDLCGNTSNGFWKITDLWFQENRFLWWFIQRSELLWWFYSTKRTPGFIKLISHSIALFVHYDKSHLTMLNKI